MIYIADTDKTVYKQIIDGTQRTDICYTKSIPESGYVLINADNIPLASPHVQFGIILLSGNAENLSEFYAGHSDNVFCTLDAVLTFLNSGSVWSRGIFSDAQQRAKLLLHYIGMDTRLCGFDYLAFLVAYLSYSPNASFKYDVIPKMREVFGKSAESMERAMRYAVEVTWANGDINAQQAVFGYTVNPEKGKPVTREFAAMIAEVLREQSAQ